MSLALLKMPATLQPSPCRPVPSAHFPRRGAVVLALWLLCLSCSPATNASDPESEPSQILLEAFVVEAREPFFQPSFDALTAAAGGDTSMIFRGDDGGARSLRERLEAAHRSGRIRITAAPSVLTLSGQAVAVQSGLQVPVQTVANDTVTVQFVNATLRFDATATVTPAGRIVLDVNVQKRYPETGLETESGPWPIQTTEIRARVPVDDGGTAVLGGVYESRLESPNQRGVEVITLITARKVNPS